MGAALLGVRHPIISVGWLRGLLEDFLGEHGQVDAPVAPDVATLGLEVSVLVVLGVEVGTQVIIVLDQEVGLADANPETLMLMVMPLAAGTSMVS